MTPQDVRRFYEALSAGDAEALEAALAEDVILHFPGDRFGTRAEGRRKVLIFLRRNQRLFDGGLTFRVEWVGATEDRLVATWTNAGRTKSGLDYANRGCTVFRVADGKLVEIQDYLDTHRIEETWPR